MSVSAAVPATNSPWLALRLIAADIKLAHSIFALPFAVLATFLVSPWAGYASSGGGLLDAWNDKQRFWLQLALIVVCMVLARTWAMLVNRLADRDIDARNARTQRRVFARGALTVKQGWIAAGLCAAGFIAVCGLFGALFGNLWPLSLSVPVLAWIAFYSFTKRFTALCHIVLGAALATSPLAAVIAIDPAALGITPVVWWLAGFVLLWVAGFDVIYALQDRDFDRANKLSSIPAKLGTRGAVWVSRVLHALAFAALIMAYRSEPRFGHLFLVGVAAVAVLLLVEHTVVTRLARQSLTPNPDGTDNPPPALNMAFFTLNGVVSVILGAAGVLEVFL
ncbi:MAG TPA: 4-hydroxybenzoate octaprenyltransferase [Phycisphaerales bacterium]|nr:4-hydroxybenzoate octaprenyltransferase [Phycisphaerales bacterium]